MTDILTTLAADPAAGILAAADLREQRAKAATPGPWAVGGIGAHVVLAGERTGHELDYRTVAVLMMTQGNIQAESANAEHIAAEANPAHALAAVRRWRGVVERHAQGDPICLGCSEDWPCDDVLDTVDEVRAYLGGTA